ncbi:MAG: hypothetical protein HKP37_11800 [Boseongicola sp.]|nr:hypothetical protein [Boseongicola sp.]
MLSVAPCFANAQTELVFEGNGQRLYAIVAEAEPIFTLGRHSVQFRLQAESSDAFRSMTSSMIGETLAVSVCGRPLLEAVVREKLDGVGIVNVPTGEAAVAVTEVIKGSAECSTLELHFNE